MTSNALISLANRFLSVLFSLNSVISQLRLKCSLPTIESSAMRPNGMKSTDAQTRKYVSSALKHAMNPLPPKKFHVHERSGGILDLTAPSVLKHAARKTERIVNSGLSEREKLLLVEILAKRKALGKRARFHNLSAGGAFADGFIPRITVKLNAKGTSEVRVNRESVSVDG